MKKKKIILIVIGLIISIIICLFGIRLYNSKKYYKIGKEIYNKALADYANEKYKYETDEKGNYIDYLFNEGKKYYKVLNMDEVLNDFASSNKKNFLTDIDAINEENSYYVPTFTNNELVNWVDYDVKYSSSLEDKVTFKVITTFCGDVTSEGGTCNEDEYKTIYTKFVMIKEKNEWKIDFFELPKYEVTSSEDDE